MIFIFIAKMLRLMKIFERKSSSLSLRVLGAAPQPGNSPLTEPRQALPATLRCPQAPKGSDKLCRHHSHWPGLAPRGQGGKIRRKASGVPLGRAKDPGFLSSHGGAGASSRNTMFSSLSRARRKGQAPVCARAGQGVEFPQRAENLGVEPRKIPRSPPPPPTPTAVLLP